MWPFVLVPVLWRLAQHAVHVAQAHEPMSLRTATKYVRRVLECLDTVIHNDMKNEHNLRLFIVC